MIDYIFDTLRVFYSINAEHIEKVQGGWSADAYSVKTKNSNYFLKVFDKHRHTGEFWIDRIDYYMPIVFWLNDNTSFKDELVMPISANDGSYKFENADNVFMLYPYINGYTLAEKRLSSAQQKDLAAIVSNLHMCGQKIPENMLHDVENFDVSFCDELLSIMEEKGMNSNPLEKIWNNYKNSIAENIKILKQYAEELPRENLQFVLCHTDLHGWNLMQADKLLLLDWEGLKFAPAEADIFSFTEGFFFDYVYDSFMSVYQQIYPDYVVNQKAMDFYRIRRRLEDVTDFAKSILFDNISESDINKSLRALERECSLL